MELHIPTSLSDEEIARFQKIYRKIHGLKLSKTETEKEALSLIRFIAVVIDRKDDCKQ
jgi:hypothetical protein